MSNETDQPRPQPEDTTKMGIAKGKAPVLSCAATPKTGLPVPEISIENSGPKSRGEYSSTASSKSAADISHATQGTVESRSSEPSKSGNSTDSSDQPLARSRSTQTCKPLPKHLTRPSQSSQVRQPRPKSRSTALFLRGMLANCGCLYIVETGISGLSSYRDLLESGLPMRGRCSLCNVLVTEIRFSKDGEAEVTEIIQRPEEEQAGYAEDLMENYIDEDVDDHDSGEGSRSQAGRGEDEEGGSGGGVWGDCRGGVEDEADDTDDECGEEEKVGVYLQ